LVQNYLTKLQHGLLDLPFHPLYSFQLTADFGAT